MTRTITQALHKSIAEIQHCLYLGSKYQKEKDKKVLELIEATQILLQELLTVLEKKER